MKKVLFVFLFISFLTSSKGQQMSTIRQVYDFNVDDEFQYHWDYNPPNATRIIITEKHFSALNDTVFYSRHFDNYFTQVNWNPSPHLDYFFDEYNDTIFYTDLDTLINAQFQNWPIDSANGNWFRDTLYYSTQFCGRLIYEYLGCLGCVFEGHFYKAQYGQGLGLVESIHQWPGQPQINDHYYMTYYKKGIIECGIDDTTTLSIIELKSQPQFTISPNPFTQSAQITLNQNYQHIALEVYNLQGQLVAQHHYSNTAHLTLQRNHLPAGLYFLKLTLDNNLVQTAKIVIGE